MERSSLLSGLRSALKAFCNCEATARPPEPALRKEQHEYIAHNCSHTLLPPFPQGGSSTDPTTTILECKPARLPKADSLKALCGLLTAEKAEVDACMVGNLVVCAVVEEEGVWSVDGAIYSKRYTDQPPERMNGRNESSLSVHGVEQMYRLRETLRLVQALAMPL